MTYYVIVGAKNLKTGAVSWKPGQGGAYSVGPFVSKSAALGYASRDHGGVLAHGVPFKIIRKKETMRSIIW
jgi:hypothetical protein